MTHRRLIFSNPTRMLTDNTRLTALKNEVDALASDLATLDGKTEDERLEDAATRESVMQHFENLAKEDF